MIVMYTNESGKMEMQKYMQKKYKEEEDGKQKR